MPESTAPLPLPKIKRRDKSLRTSLVRLNNEKQLELSWTEAPAPDDELPSQASLTDEATRHATPKPDDSGAEEVPRRAYPLAYDPEGTAGPVLALLMQVKEEAAQAVTAYGDGDIDTTVSRIAVIAALMSKAYPHTAFNPALGAAVSFVRRATLLVDATEVSMQELMALAKATRHLADSPLISLEASVDLITDLEEHSWVGADPQVAAFVSTLFGGEESAEPTNTQAAEKQKDTLE